MEGLNYEIMEMTDKLQIMRYQQRINAQKIGDTDRYGFPFEPADSFSTDPLGFIETAMRLQAEAAELYSFTREFNRHSPQYYQMSAQLEKLVSQLGSVCITKAVIEQQEGQEFPWLDTLTIEWLRKISAFQFRKCYESYMESMTYLNYNGSALSLSIRWAALDKRLQATGDKIEGIKTGKVNVDLNNKPESVKKQDENVRGSESREESPAAFSPKGSALPVDKAAAREAAAERDGNEQSAGVSEPDAKPVPTISADADVPEEKEETDIPYVSDDLIRRMTQYYSSLQFQPAAEEQYEDAGIPGTAPP